MSIVGKQELELFVPDGAGTIIPNRELCAPSISSLTGAGSGSSVSWPSWNCL